MPTLRSFGRKMVKNVKAFRADEEGSLSIESVLMITVAVFLLIGVMELCGVNFDGTLDEQGLFISLKTNILDYIIGE